MLVTLAFRYLSGFCPIPALRAEISGFYAKVPVLYTKIPDFYVDIYLFGFHSDSNVCGRFHVDSIYYVANYGVHTMCG